MRGAPICHVCNDVGGWGKGFVVAISQRWPQPEAQYRAWYAQGEAAGFRLGAIQLVDVGPGLKVATWSPSAGFDPLVESRPFATMRCENA